MKNSVDDVWDAGYKKGFSDARDIFEPLLRDKFAIAAPEPDKADIWHEFVRVERHVSGGENNLIPDDEKLRVACKLRYKFADAMMKERNKDE